MALLLPQVASAYDFEVDNLYYDINDDGASVVVNGYSKDIIGEMVIPSSVAYNGKNYSVTSIGVRAFYGCKGLTSLIIPSTVTEINAQAFFECKSLTCLNIPNSVIKIDVSAFAFCSGLTNVTISKSVTEIGYYAFYGCTSLTSIIIPKSVTVVNGSSFGGCTGLTSIIVEDGNKVYDSRDNCNAIVETASNTLIMGCENTTIPNSVTKIGLKAFADFIGLRSVAIPNSVKVIGIGAFAGCIGLTDVTIPYSVTTIGELAFTDCTGLTNVTIPNSVTIIGTGAFYGCSGLTSIHSRIVNPSDCLIVERVFSEVDKDKCILYVPPKSIGLYKKAEQWRDFKNIKAETGTSTTKKGDKGIKKRNRRR